MYPSTDTLSEWLRRWTRNPLGTARKGFESLKCRIAGSSRAWNKTKVMTTEAQPPSFLSTPAGLQIEILEQQSCHKWLGCMWCMPPVNKKRHDVDQHLQAASKAFFCHRATLYDRNILIGKRLPYFDAVISPVAVSAAGHRTLYKTDLRNFDVLFRKLIRSVVGLPAGMDWTRPWHEILHDWNGRVNEFAALHGIKLWSKRCVQQHWNLAHYIFLWTINGGLNA